MGRSRSGRRGPFSTGRLELLRLVGQEHGKGSALQTTRVISAHWAGIQTECPMGGTVLDGCSHE